MNSPAERQAAKVGITALTVCGFKSLVDETRISVRPLTVIAGANSSGKSSIVQPLLMLKQTLDSTFDAGPLLLDGPNVRFTSAEQILSRMGKRVAKTLSAGIEVGAGNALRLDFESSDSGLDVSRMTWTRDGKPIELRRDMTPEEIQRAFADPGSAPLAPWKPFEDTEPQGVARARCFLTVTSEIANVLVNAELFEVFGLGWPFFPNHIRLVIHVPGLRGNPERTYRASGVGRHFPGVFQDYVASIVSHWKNESDSRLNELADDLRCLGLSWKLDARPVDETRVELRVGRLPEPQRGGARDLVSIADVGLGVSQVLPVLVALRSAEPGQLVYLEQPEIHLHPRAQNALARILAQAAQRGVRVLVETHSELLLLGLQTLVAQGNLKPDLVKLHWFQRDDHGRTTVESADLDRDGAFGDWPEDFADVALQAESRFLDASEALRAGK